jgi:serine/threonine-protein kinase
LISKEDIDFCKVILRKGLLSPEEIDECLSIIDQRRELGIEKRVQDIILEKGLLTPRECSRIEERFRTPPKSDLIAGYRIIGQIGEGAMATVYKAEHLRLGKVVALKVLSSKLTANPPYLKRFLREARSAARLNHPNIIKAYDVGESGGRYYFAMEFVDGENLQRILAWKGVLEEKEVLEMGLQIGRALEHAFRKNIIHRDLKPENILLGTDGVIKVADFGLAREASTDGCITRVGRAVGTPHFFSPEQCEGREGLDTRSDIYSLGVTLFYLATGRFPFEGARTEDIMRAHIREEAPSPATYNRKLSSAFCRVVGRMLRRDLDERYPSPAKLVADMEALLGCPETRGHESVPERGGPPRPREPSAAEAGVMPEVTPKPRRLHKRMGRRGPLYVLLKVGGAIAIIILALCCLILLHKILGEDETFPGGGDRRNGKTAKTERRSEAAMAEFKAIMRGADRSLAAVVIIKLRDFERHYAGTDAADRARKERVLLKSRWRREAEERFERIRDRAASLARAGKLSGAIDLYQALPSWVGKAGFRNRIEREMGVLKDRLRGRFSRDLELAAQYAAEDRLSKALEVLEGVKQYGDHEQIRLAERMAEEIRTKRKESR